MSNTIGDLVKFVLDNRKGNAFPDYTGEQILKQIVDCRDNGSLFYAVNPDNKLVGIACAILHHEEKVLEISDILTIEKWVLARFVNHFVQNFNGWSLEGLRHNKRKHYNTERFCHKVMKGVR